MVFLLKGGGAYWRVGAYYFNLPLGGGTIGGGGLFEGGGLIGGFTVYAVLIAQ